MCYWCFGCNCYALGILNTLVVLGLMRFDLCVCLCLLYLPAWRLFDTVLEVFGFDCFWCLLCLCWLGILGFVLIVLFGFGLVV